MTKDETECAIKAYKAVMSEWLAGRLTSKAVAQLPEPERALYSECIEAAPLAFQRSLKERR
jgi:hypothetical protein